MKLDINFALFLWTWISKGGEMHSNIILNGIISNTSNISTFKKKKVMSLSFNENLLDCFKYSFSTARFFLILHSSDIMRVVYIDSLNWYPQPYTLHAFSP